MNRCLFYIGHREWSGHSRRSKSSEIHFSIIEWMSVLFRSVVDNDLHTLTGRKWVKFASLSSPGWIFIFSWSIVDNILDTGSRKEKWGRRCGGRILVLVQLRWMFDVRRILDSRVIYFEALSRRKLASNKKAYQSHQVYDILDVIDWTFSFRCFELIKAQKR
jgi:hypothetical protein